MKDPEICTHIAIMILKWLCQWYYNGL